MTDLPADVEQLIDTPQYPEVGEFPVEQGYIWTSCASVENGNPLFWDDEVATELTGGRIAPPTMVSVWFRPHHWRPGRTEPQVPLQSHFDLKVRFDLPEAVMSDNTLVFHEPVRVGDRLRTHQVLRSVSDEKTTKLGTGRFWVIDVVYHNQRDELVCIESYTGFGYRRDAWSTTSTLTLANVHVGDTLPVLVYDVSSTTVVLGALAARDWRPMHHDYHFATERNGTQDIFLNTPNQAAWFERYVTDWTGPKGRLGRMTFRMKGSVFPGDTMAFRATVTEVVADSAGCGWVGLDVSLTVGDIVATTCTVRVAVPVDDDDNPWTRRGDAWRPCALDDETRTEPMDLDFTDEQAMLRETVRGVCDKHASLTVVREVEDDPIGYPESFWTHLADLGLLGLTISEQYGGSGMTMLDAAIVYEEFGRALAPSPHFVSSVMSGGVLERSGSDDQRAEWLPRIAAGEAVLTPAWLEPNRGFGPRGVQLRAEIDGDAFVLSGTKRHVRFAQAADTLVVLARTESDDAAIDLFLVPRDAPGLALTQQMSVASDAQFRVDFDGVRVPASARIGAAGSGWETWDATMRDGLVLLAAYAMGGAAYALEITVQYAKDRRQFDKPLGAFQALAHYLADAKGTVDGGRTLVWEAAWARDNGRPVDRLAPMAKLFATQTFRDVTAMAQQIFGGVGFTVEYDIQLYFRRAKALQLDWWDTRYLEELVAASVLDG